MDTLNVLVQSRSFHVTRALCCLGALVGGAVWSLLRMQSSRMQEPKSLVQSFFSSPAWWRGTMLVIKQIMSTSWIEVKLKEKGKCFRICRPSGLLCCSPDGYFWVLIQITYAKCLFRFSLGGTWSKNTRWKSWISLMLGNIFVLHTDCFLFWLKDIGHFCVRELS